MNEPLEQPAGPGKPRAVSGGQLALLALAGVLAVAAVGLACSFVGLVQTTEMVWRLRIYRLIASSVVGAGLAAAGMSLQGLLRNPLADPYVLGISSGAGVGVLLGLALVGRWVLPEQFSTPVLAFGGAILTCITVYGIAQRRGRLDAYSLILSGVIVSIFNGAIMLSMYLFVDPYRIPDFARWSMGQIPEAVDSRLLLTCGLCVVGGWALLFWQGSALNALGLGDEVAASSGVAVNRLRIVVFLLVGIMTAAAVALAGPVGFVGLIVPHICRMTTGPDHRRLLIISGFAGAVFLMLADTLCRTAGPLIGVNKIPVGVVTALAGGPFFIFLLRRKFREMPI